MGKFSSISYARYILLQRTELQKYRNWFLYKLLRGTRFSINHNTAILGQAVIYSKKILDQYVKLLEKDFNEIKYYLPESAQNILDIGCGLGGINIYISKYYNNDLEIILYDKSTIDKNIYYSYNSTGVYYNSLSLAKKYLFSNGIPVENITVMECHPDNLIPIRQNIDIIISLLSCGFHYPLNTYLDQILSLISKRGVLILDIRKGKNEMSRIRDSFKCNPIIIRDTEKYRRIVIKN